MLRDLPFGDPRGYAIAYYLQYPALTILFYPPMLAVSEALVFLVTGPSPAAAQLVIALYAAAAGAGFFAVAARFMSRGLALCCSLAFLSLPEMMLWGRQVMLEIPAFAWLLWAVWFALRFEAEGRPRLAWVAALLLLCALYTKLSVVFVAVPLLLILLSSPRLQGLWRPALWAGVAAVVLSIPLVWMTLGFGQANVQSMHGVADAAAERWSWQGWFWYATQFPSQLGWFFPLAVLGSLFGPFAVPSKDRRVVALLIWGWLLAGYVFFSLIDLKESRHSIFLLAPMVLGAGLLADRWARRWGTLLIAAALCANLAQAVTASPVPRVSGLREAASEIVTLAPAGATTVFSGYRDGSFIFNLRSLDAKRQHRVIRADKLLLELSVRRGLGVRELDVSRDAMLSMFADYWVDYLVIDPDFWVDLAVMRRFSEFVADGPFERIRTIDIQANTPGIEKQYVVYRYVGPRSAERKPLSVKLKMIDSQFDETQGR